MKRIVLAVAGLLLFSLAHAQKDPKAKKVLDDASTVFQSYGTIEADFSYTLENKQTNTKETQEGAIKLKGNKYQVDLSGVVQYFDGENLMVWLKDSEEVQLSEPSEEEISNPSQIFTLYQKNFRYLYRQKVTVKGKSMHEVEIAPEKLNKPYSKIIIWVEEKTNLISTFTTVYKNGTLHTIEISNVKFNTTIPDTAFKFDEKANPDVEVIDVR